jgi:hypothetical protein
VARTGWGRGLAIARQAVNAQGGDITDVEQSGFCSPARPQTFVSIGVSSIGLERIARSRN